MTENRLHNLDEKQLKKNTGNQSTQRRSVVKIIKTKNTAKHRGLYQCKQTLTKRWEKKPSATLIQERGRGDIKESLGQKGEKTLEADKTEADLEIRLPRQKQGTERRPNTHRTEIKKQRRKRKKEKEQKDERWRVRPKRGGVRNIGTGPTADQS